MIELNYIMKQSKLKLNFSSFVSEKKNCSYADDYKLGVGVYYDIREC